MGFLTPLFLLGLLAVALPILLHLSRKRQTRLVDFPSLMFLNRVPYRSVRRRRVRDLLLMLLRCAAYGLLAIAFARPLINASVLDRSDLSSHTVVLLDRSFSMSRGELWSQAVEAAVSALDSVPEETVVSVVAFDQSAEILAEASADLASARQRVQELLPSDATTSYSTAVKMARRLLLDVPTEERKVVMISDFQRSGLEAGDDLTLPAGTIVETVALPDPARASPNVAITELEIDPAAGARATAGSNREVLVSARIVHQPGEPAIVPADSDSASSTGQPMTVSVKLTLGGRDVETRQLQLAPSSSESVTFRPARLEAGIDTLGAVTIDIDEPLVADNRFDFVLSASEGLPVAVVREGTGTSQRRRGRYLDEALSLGRSPRFDIRNLQASELSSEALEDRPLVLLDDSLGALSAASVQALQQHLDNDGGLLVSYGRAAERAAANAGALELPVPTEIRRSRSGEQGIAYLDLDHPALKLFSSPRSGDFSAARVFAYHEIDAAGVATRVLARFSSGAPALLEVEREVGRVLVMTSSLDTTWGDLPVQPVFLPLIHETLRYLGDQGNDRSWYEVGQVVDLGRAVERLERSEGRRGDEGARDWLIIDPRGDEQTRSFDPQAGSSDTASDQVSLSASSRPLVAVDARGIWRARPVASDRQQAISFAVNLNAIESDLAPLDVEVFEASLDTSEIIGQTSLEGVDPAAAEALRNERDRGQRWWWYLLGLLLVVLGLETWMASRRTLVNRGRSGTGGMAREVS